MKGDNIKRVSRRKLMNMIAAGGAGVALTTPAKSEVRAEGNLGMTAEAQAATVTPLARAFSGQHAPRPLPFDPAKLKGISEKLIKSHWENNYSGAVKALNAVEQRLASMLTEKDLPPYIYGDLKREELVRTAPFCGASTRNQRSTHSACSTQKDKVVHR